MSPSGKPALQPPKVVISCTAEEVVKFLTSLDSGGKTVIHNRFCTRRACACPKRLTESNVRNMVGKLRTISNSNGRVGGEKCASLPEVNRSVLFMCEEQPPSSLAKHYLWSRRNLFTYWLNIYNLASETLLRVPFQRYLLTCDIFFFVIDFFTGDRASDLGRVQSHSFQLISRVLFSTFLLGKPWEARVRLIRLFCCQSHRSAFVQLHGSAITWITTNCCPSPSTRGMCFGRPRTKNSCQTGHLLVQPSATAFVPIS